MQVLFVSGIGGDTRRYRCTHHQEQLALHSIQSVLREADDTQLYIDAATCDVVILHRVPWAPLIEDVVEIAHRRGKPMVFETDDLIFAPELFDRIAYLDTLPPDQAKRFRTDLQHQVETFAQCDCVLTTTQYLADAAIARGKAALVQRNAFSAEMVAAAESAVAEHSVGAGGAAGSTNRPVVIGYFSGTGSHNQDFAVVAPVLAELMGRFPTLWLHISGHLDIGGQLLGYQDRIRRAPYVAWRELPNLIAAVDINLAPLELDNPFCQAKSEIKFTEAALVSVPTVASPSEAFAFAIEDGVTGLLAPDADGWRQALTRLIEDAAFRTDLGEAARRRVYEVYVPERMSQRLVATLNAIVEQYTPAAADPATTLAEVVVRMHARLERQRRTWPTATTGGAIAPDDRTMGRSNRRTGCGVLARQSPSQSGATDRRLT